MPKVRYAFLSLSLAGAMACAGRPVPSAQLPPGAVEAEQERQRQLALLDFERHQARLDSIAHPLLTAATTLCPGAVGYRLGMRVATIHDYEKPWRPAAEMALGLGDTLSVLSVVRDGPAARAGLRLGDRIVRLNGRDIPPGSGAVAAMGEALAGLRDSARDRLDLAYLRGESRGETTLAPGRACDYDVHVLVGGELNAYADGGGILVTSAMMRFAADDELAVILAHELAHKAMEHTGPRQRNALVRPPDASAGVAVGGYHTSDPARSPAPSFSLASERQADYVGLYAMALAGFPLDAAPRFWRHMAQADPESIGLASTHPTPAERFVRMEQAIAEIERKRAAGVALAPVQDTAQTAAAPPAAPQPAAAPDTAAERPRAALVRSVAELQLDQGLRQTLGDITRLRIAQAYEEVEPGLLVLALTPGAWSVTSAEYNLKRLYLAYSEATLWPEQVELELWQQGRVIGRYTRAGLILEPDSAASPAD